MALLNARGPEPRQLRLARDNRGMGYRSSNLGKKKRLPTSRHICIQCGKTFFGHRAKKYCSKACYTTNQTILTEIPCPVCTRTFTPQSSDQKTCSSRCGIVSRSATRSRRTIATQRSHLDNEAVLKAARGEPRKEITEWSLHAILTCLEQIKEELGGKMPTYSQLLRDAGLISRFKSNSLAGAIFRYNKENRIETYQDFVFKFLGWIIPSRFTCESLAKFIGAVVSEFGGIPLRICEANSVLGVKGSYLCFSIKKKFNITLDEYCRLNSIARVPPL